VAGQVITTTNAQGQAVTTTSPVASVLINNLGSIISAGRTASASPSVTSASGSASSQASDVTTTDQYGNTVVLSHASYGEVITATDARGSTFVTTYTPGGGAVSSLVLYTTTLPNGQRETITSLAVVGAAGATSAPAAASPAAATTTSKGTPGLQNAAAPFARSFGPGLVALVSVAVGFALLM